MRILGFLLGAVLLGIVLLAGGVMGNALPLDEPPGKLVRLYVYLNTHVAETVEGSPFPELRPKHYALEADALFGKVKEAIGRLPHWEIVQTSDAEREIHAVVTSRIFRFKDDVTVNVAQKEGHKPAVMVRSTSRVGKGDLGANTRHVLDLYDELERVGAHGETERLSRVSTMHGDA